MNEFKKIIKKYEATIEGLESNFECLKGFHTCVKDEDIRRALLGTLSKLEESQLDLTKMYVSINIDIQKEMFEILRIIDKDRRNCIIWINLALMIRDLGDLKTPVLIQCAGLGDIIMRLRMIFVMMDKYARLDEKDAMLFEKID